MWRYRRGCGLIEGGLTTLIEQGGRVTRLRNRPCFRRAFGGLSRSLARLLAEQGLASEWIGLTGLGAERRVLDVSQLGLARAVAALELDVLANCVVKNAHHRTSPGVDG